MKKAIKSAPSSGNDWDELDDRVSPMVQTTRRTVTFDLDGLAPFMRGDNLEVTLDVQSFNGPIISEEFARYMERMNPDLIGFMEDTIAEMQDEIRLRQWARVFAERCKTQE